MIQDSLPTVAIFNPGYPAARWISRALRLAGCPQRTHSSHPFSTGRLSLHMRRVYDSPATEDYETLEAWARARMEAGEIQLIAPISDLTVYLGARLQSLTPEPWRSRLPSADSIMACILKDRFIEHCQAAGVPVPRTAIGTRPEELIEQTRNDVGFPAVAKPRSHVAWISERGSVVENVDELHAYLKAIPPLTPMLEASMPEQRWPVVQQFLPAAASACCSVSGFIDAEGKVHAGASRKLAQWPNRTGVGTAFVRDDREELIRTGASHAGRLLNRGPFELELVPSPDSDELLAIDLNPRFFGQMDLDIHAGRDLPVWWVDNILGRPLTQTKVMREARFAIHPLLFPLQGEASLSAPTPEINYRTIMDSKPVCLGLVWGDWLGNFAYLLRGLIKNRSLFKHRLLSWLKA